MSALFPKPLYRTLQNLVQALFGAREAGFKHAVDMARVISTPRPLQMVDILPTAHAYYLCRFSDCVHSIPGILTKEAVEKIKSAYHLENLEALKGAVIQPSRIAIVQDFKDERGFHLYVDDCTIMGGQGSPPFGKTTPLMESPEMKAALQRFQEPTATPARLDTQKGKYEISDKEVTLSLRNSMLLQRIEKPGWQGLDCKMPPASVDEEILDVERDSQRDTEPSIVLESETRRLETQNFVEVSSDEDDSTISLAETAEGVSFSRPTATPVQNMMPDQSKKRTSTTLSESSNCSTRTIVKSVTSTAVEPASNQTQPKKSLPTSLSQSAQTTHTYPQESLYASQPAISNSYRSMVRKRRRSMQGKPLDNFHADPDPTPVALREKKRRVSVSEDDIIPYFPRTEHVTASAAVEAALRLLRCSCPTPIRST